MNEANGQHDKELQELSQIIVSALTSNDEVMGVLAELKERGIVDSSTLIGLALRVNDFMEVSGTAFPRPCPGHQKQKRAITPKANKVLIENLDTRNIIDGKDLTNSEAEFEDWAMDHFNEYKWLQKLGIAW